MYEIETKICSKNGWDTPEQAKGRYGRYSREGVTIHWWGDGTGASNHNNIVNYFMQQAQAGIKSPNYVLSDNKITMMVEPDNVAWCSTKGNPTTISIECQPTLGDEGYKRLGWLIAMLEKKYNHKMNIYPHKYWQQTDCPGTISLDRARKEADTLNTSVALASKPEPTPVQTATTVTLPATVESWAAYKVDSQYRKGTSDQIGTLLPSKFGGLTYKIVENRGNVVIIDTQSFGRVAIWVKGTEAIVGGGSAIVAKPSALGSTVTFPSTVQNWAVYRVDSAYRKGTSDQVGALLPSKYGGLTYPIVEKRGSVVIIDTQAYGRVAAWVKDTNAIIK